MLLDLPSVCGNASCNIEEASLERGIDKDPRNQISPFYPNSSGVVHTKRLGQLGTHDLNGNTS